jgi:endonuclease YncB( thermonuclease family)
MKKLLLILLAVPALALAQKTPKGVTYDAQIVRVSDGDTIVIAAPFLPAPLKPELAVRVFGVDTPEKGHRAQCPGEDARGQAASEFTKNAVKSTKKHQVVLYGWDKFGGRVLGDMILDGVSLRS